MYALLGLLELQREGIELSPETRNAMRAVLEIDIEIETCDGCIYSRKKTKQIVSDWKL